MSCFWITKSRFLHTALTTKLSDTKSVRFELGFVRSTWKCLFLLKIHKSFATFVRVDWNIVTLFSKKRNSFIVRDKQTRRVDLLGSLTLRMALWSFERSVNIYELTWYHDAADCDIQLHVCENIKSLFFSLSCLQFFTNILKFPKNISCPSYG